MSYKIKQLMGLQRNLEPEVVRAIMSLAHTIGFTETLFVSSAGDNSDGSSWNRAYTNLRTALDWIEANQAAGEVHCIMLQGGAWDLDLTGVPTYAANIAIYGVDSRSRAVISNGHATATGVLQFTGWCSINNISINCGTGENGINLNGAGASGSRIRKVGINCLNVAAAVSAILLDGGVEYVKITDVGVLGELGITHTTGIHLDEADHCLFYDLHLNNCFIGIHLDNAADDLNEFYNTRIRNCATGLQIDLGASTDNFFHHMDLTNNTVNIDDNGTTTVFELIHFDAVATVSPDDVTGILVVSGVGANAWTAVAVQIRAASATPFKIVGIAFECAAAEKTGIRLFSDGGTVPIYQDLIETGAAVAGKAEPSQTEPIWVNQGLAIHAEVKSEAGGNNVLIWLKIQIV